MLTGSAFSLLLVILVGKWMSEQSGYTEQSILLLSTLMASNQLVLYAIFHLNLAYSSIEEEQRSEVMRRCYWPLLRLASEYNLPFGIEASGYTLETAAAIDKSWVDELRGLTTQGSCEFIGSGYAQIIGPLVPAEINAANLRLGHQVYEQLLGFLPRIALVNEQAYSAGLVQHYLDAGYRAIVMEWDNPARYHPEWDREWRYLPQFVCGQHGEEIPLIWSESMAFQKLQRYAHGEMDLDEYLDYLCRHLRETPRALSLYSNDVEIFDFRPGRYQTEAVIHEVGEWKRIGQFLEALLADGRFRFICPSEALNLLQVPGAANRLRLESPEQPIPVKKQEKYNITRWAVTGRDDLGINTACWRIYELLRSSPTASDDEWRELCYLWSSDFRTHITEGRWHQYLEQLAGFEERVGARVPSTSEKHPRALEARVAPARNRPLIKRQGRHLMIEGTLVRVRLNCQRGLAIDGLWLGSLEGPQLCGTLPHAYYDDISMSADWYTGHVVLEAPGQPKVTDLNPVEPRVETLDSGDVVIEGTVTTILGPVVKRVQVSAVEPELILGYVFDWENAPAGSFRLGNITLNPLAFERSTLRYRTHNGGRNVETYPMAGTTVEQGSPVSFLISAGNGIGITGGWVELGDARHSLRVEVDKTAAALVGLVTYREMGDSYFCRLALSAGEMDETRRKAELSDSRKIWCKIRLVSD